MADLPERWWWFSFTDPERQSGQQFLGAAMVRGQGMGSALLAACLLGLDPGGELTITDLGLIPETKLPRPELRERLLSLDDLVREGIRPERGA